MMIFHACLKRHAAEDAAADYAADYAALFDAALLDLPRRATICRHITLIADTVTDSCDLAAIEQGQRLREYALLPCCAMLHTPCRLRPFHDVDATLTLLLYCLRYDRLPLCAAALMLAARHTAPRHEPRVTHTTLRAFMPRRLLICRRQLRYSEAERLRQLILRRNIIICRARYSIDNETLRVIITRLRAPLIVRVMRCHALRVAAAAVALLRVVAAHVCRYDA